MRQSKKIFASILLLLLVTACVPSDLVIIQEAPAEEGISVAEAAPRPLTTPDELPSATPVEPAATTEPPTEVPPAATAEPPAEVPTRAPMPAQADSNCLICHTDQQALIAVAAPIEEPEDSLSSGVG